MKLRGLDEVLFQGGESGAPSISELATSIQLPVDLFSEDETYQEQSEAPVFNENLAEFFDDSELDTLAEELLQDIDQDEQDRAPWMEMIANVKEQLNIGEDSSYEEPFPGSSSVNYPIFTKAQIHFLARALPEIYPNNPVKTLALGDSTPELENQAKRVKDVMNYQIQYQDPGNKTDFRKMLWWLPITGSAFRHVYHDPLRNINMVRYVSVEDFIVPYGTISLYDAPRFAHRYYEGRNTMLKLMKKGYYRDISLQDASESGDMSNPVQQIKDAGDGQERTGLRSLDQENYLVYVDYDFENHPELRDMDEGGPTGIGLPYMIIINKNSRKVLAIYRNWKEDDELKLKRIYYAHYRYQEGPGFYGSGLPHLIGSIQEATTGALRAFGDGLAFSTMPAGWKSKDAKFSGEEVLSPGTFCDVDMTTDDINKAIKIANFAPPSPQVIQYIQMLDREAQAIVSTQDVVTGSTSPQNAPVGSTVAMIEQANKVITEQHKCMFESFSEELRILADLNYDFLPDEAQFKLPGRVGIIRRSDFDGQIDVIPTADPSVSSFMLRQAIDQAVMQYASIPEFKPWFREGGYPLLRRLFENLNVPSPDEIILTPEEVMQQEQQQQQNPPPPSPDEIKAQAMMQDAQVKSMMAEMKAQADTMKSILEFMKLQVTEKKNDMDFVLRNKEIDSKTGMVSPEQEAMTDGLAAREVQQEMQQPEIPEKKGVLIWLMNKIRGKAE